MLVNALIERGFGLEGTPARCRGEREAREPAAVQRFGASPDQLVLGSRKNGALADCAPSALAQESRRKRSDLTGLKILLVEDEYYVAAFIENILLDLGCTIVGPSADLAEAIGMAKAEAFDAAILDINLGGESVYPVADFLFENGTPFVFATAYAMHDIPETYQNFPLVRKPFTVGTLKREILALW
jgi:CheY-like chemotaxis protein